MLSSVAADLIHSKSCFQDSQIYGQIYQEIVASSYNDDYDRSDNEYDSRQPKRYSPREQSFSTLGGLLKNPKQMGAGLLGVGALLTVMGVMLFFEGTLLRLGNVSVT